MPAKKKDGKPEENARIVAAMKALSNENRLAIFERIRSGQGQGTLDSDDQLTVCEVASTFNIALSTISHHIKELRAGGLITCGRQGQTIR